MFALNRNWIVVLKLPWEDRNVDTWCDVRTSSNIPTRVVQQALCEQLGGQLQVSDLYADPPAIQLVEVRDYHQQNRLPEVDLMRAMGYVAIEAKSQAGANSP